MTEKLVWRLNEVIAFIEERIIDGIATEEELAMYENYVWNGKINKITYKSLLLQMKKEYMGL